MPSMVNIDSIYRFMGEKLSAAMRGEKTGIEFPYLNKMKGSSTQKAMRQLSRGK